MKKAIIYILSFVEFLLITNCDEQPQDSSSTNLYFPLRLGAYWVYETKANDINWHTLAEYRDSAAVTSTKTLASRNAFLVSTYREGNLTGSAYYALEGNKILRYIDEDDTLMPNLPQGWYIYADFDAKKSWNLANIFIPDYKFEIFDTVYTGTRNFTINASNAGLVRMTIDSVQFDSYDISFKDDSKGRFVYYVDHSNPSPDTVFFERYAMKNHHTRYIENVGPSFYSVDAYKDTYVNLKTGASYKYYIPGLVSKLIKYKVN